MNGCGCHSPWQGHLTGRGVGSGPGQALPGPRRAAPGPEHDLGILISVAEAKRKEQLLMFERMLLVQQSTLLNNSVLAAADILINWKGRIAQNAAEAI